LSGGYAEVLSERVIVLAQIAERAEDIDVARAQEAKARAEARLSATAPNLDVERARLALLKQLTRIRVAQRARTRG
jgi:F-type H+-transporting ATPase subunit epsilon